MRESKHIEVKNHLLSGREITGIKALNLYSVYRLSSVINRLRNEGLNIKTVMVMDESGKTQFAKYFLDN